MDNRPASSESSREEQIHQVFLIEEKRSERLVNYARFFLTLMYLGAVLSVRKELPADSFLAGLAGTVASFTWFVFIEIYLRSGRYSRRLKYISTTIDILIVSMAITAFGTYRTFKTPAFALYYLWIGLAAMRFSTRLTAFASVLSVSCFVIVIGQGILRSTADLGTLTDAYTTEKVAVFNQVLKVIFMIGFGFIAAYVSRGYHRLVMRSVDEQVRLEQEKREKEELKGVFSMYVNQHVVEKAMAEGINLQGEKRKATILFCDLRGFTELSENQSAEETVAFMNAYFTIMVDIILENNGTLDKFVGDEIMAVFGAPAHSENDALDAVRAALQMRSQLLEWNEARSEQGRQQVSFGIGIHSGEVIAGNIGSEKHIEYTVMGRNVNIASRVETLNKTFDTDILITAETLDQVSELVEVEEMKPVKVKGISKVLKTFHLVDMKTQAGHPA